MTGKTLQEWLDIYSKKTGDTVVLNDPARHLFYLPERGFCQLSLDFKKSRLIIWEVCGDGKFWHDFALMEADGQGLSSMCTTTTRNIRAYLRWLGGKDLHYGLIKNILICHDAYGRLINSAEKRKGEWFVEMYLHNNNNS